MKNKNSRVCLILTGIYIIFCTVLLIVCHRSTLGAVRCKTGCAAYDYAVENSITVQEIYKTEKVDFSVNADDFSFEHTASEATVTGYSGKGGEVYVPEVLGGLPVTGIDKGTFGKAKITVLNIPDCVTDINCEFSPTGYDNTVTLALVCCGAALLIAFILLDVRFGTVRVLFRKIKLHALCGVCVAALIVFCTVCVFALPNTAYIAIGSLAAYVIMGLARVLSGKEEDI